MIRTSVLLLMMTCACAGRGPAKVSLIVSGFDKTVVVERPLGSAQLLISYFGDPPQLISKTCIRGNGISACIQRTPDQVIWTLDVGEAEHPVAIEFGRASQSEVQVTYYTLDPRQPYEDYVPFIRQTVRVKSGNTVTVEGTILLKKETYDAARVEALVAEARKAIQADQPDSDDNLAAAVGSLRNMAVDSPEEVTRLLDEVFRTAEGGYADMIHEYVGEVGMIEEIRAEQGLHTTAAAKTRR